VPCALCLVAAARRLDEKRSIQTGITFNLINGTCSDYWEKILSSVHARSYNCIETVDLVPTMTQLTPSPAEEGRGGTWRPRSSRLSDGHCEC